MLVNTRGGGEIDAFLSISQRDGRGVLVDRFDRDPLQLRSRTLAENLFQVIGRAADQPARIGEILFLPITSSDGSVRSALYVETPIGYAAYFINPGRGMKLGQITTLTMRPFEGIAATDGNFVLLSRRDQQGRTEGAFLYHATTGKALYMDGLRKLEITPAVSPASALPALEGRVTATEVFTGSEATSAYLVADPGSGAVYVFGLASGSPRRLTVTKSDIALYGDGAFAREGSHTSDRRFLAVPIQESRTRTAQVLIADAVTGDLAVLLDVADPGRPLRLRKAAVSLEDRLGRDGGERVFSAVPRTASSGATLGVYLSDSRSGRTVYLDRPGLPDELTVSPVTIDLR